MWPPFAFSYKSSIFHPPKAFGFCTLCPWFHPYHPSVTCFFIPKHFLLEFVLGQMKSLYFIHSYGAGYFKPTIVILYPPICGITAHATCQLNWLILHNFCLSNWMVHGKWSTQGAWPISQESFRLQIQGRIECPTICVCIQGHIQGQDQS